MSKNSITKTLKAHVIEVQNGAGERIGITSLKFARELVNEKLYKTIDSNTIQVNNSKKWDQK